MAPQPPSEISIPEAITSYLNNLAYLEKSPNTIRVYRGDLNALAAFLAERRRMTLADAAVQDLNEFLYRFKDRAAATKNRHRAAIQSLFRWAVRNQLVDRHANPADSLEMVKGEKNKPAEFLQIDEVSQLLRSIREAPAPTLEQEFRNWRDFLLCAVMIHLGLRISESVPLTVADWEKARADGHHLQILGKGKKHRSIPIHEELDEWMDAFLRIRRQAEATSPYLFASWRHRQADRHLSVRKAREAVVARVDAAGIGRHISPHKLRHTFATQNRKNGTPVEVIRELLGHESIETTMRYAHVEDEDMEAAIKRQPRYL